MIKKYLRFHSLLFDVIDHATVLTHGKEIIFALIVKYLEGQERGSVLFKGRFKTEHLDDLQKIISRKDVAMLFKDDETFKKIARLKIKLFPDYTPKHTIPKIKTFVEASEYFEKTKKEIHRNDRY